jgi:hypothetical protein
MPWKALIEDVFFALVTTTDEHRLRADPNPDPELVRKRGHAPALPEAAAAPAAGVRLRAPIRIASMRLPFYGSKVRRRGRSYR